MRKAPKNDLKAPSCFHAVAALLQKTDSRLLSSYYSLLSRLHHITWANRLSELQELFVVSVPSLASPSSANFPLTEQHVPLWAVGDSVWVDSAEKKKPSDRRGCPSLQSHHMTPSGEKLPVCHRGSWKRSPRVAATGEGEWSHGVSQSYLSVMFPERTETTKT